MSSHSELAAVTNAGQGRKLNVLGHDFTVILSSAATQGQSYVFEVITPAGHFVPVHAQEHEDEYGYIVEGDFEVYLNGRIYPAKAGDILYFPHNAAHGFRNIGATPGKTLWLSTPGTQVERFFDELAAVPAGGPPDMQKLEALFAKYDTQLLPLPTA